MKEVFYRFKKLKQHKEFEEMIVKLIDNKEERNQFYNHLKNNDVDLRDDIFKVYFEQYSAERKSAMQDFTPDSLSKLLTLLTKECDIIYDPTAGTGGLIIEKWKQNKTAIIQAEEFSDDVIPYLLHNLACKNCFATVLHIDTLSRECKNIYVLEESDTYSNITLLEKNDINAQLHNIYKWV